MRSICLLAVQVAAKAKASDQVISYGSSQVLVI